MSMNIRKYSSLKRSLIVFCLFPLLAAAQSPADSLLRTWGNEKLPDTTRLNALKELSWNFWLFKDQDSALSYARMQYEFAKSRNLERHMASALHTQGAVHYLKGDYSASLGFYEKSL